ncbi:hypothetical protein O3P69_014099 [Scylla paramamosain]|uniref:Uncharacterized protein n=1 Tax=Scylla paramamosain TaxID=85552 RepID=A0AAW0SRA5_SCYPA
MLPLNKDSTISSKVSEYDNVPVLPIDYHNHVPAPFPASIDDLSPVPQHRSSLSSSSTFAVSTVSPSYSLQCEESASATPRLLQFPTEENQLPFDTEKKQQQQQHAQRQHSHTIITTAATITNSKVGVAGGTWVSVSRLALRGMKRGAAAGSSLKPTSHDLAHTHHV